MKSSLTGERRALLQKIRSIVFTNPFSATRKRLDAEILGHPVESDPRGASLGDYNLEYKIPLMIAARAREELLAIPEPERRLILAAGGDDAILLRDVIGFILFH